MKRAVFVVLVVGLACCAEGARTTVPRPAPGASVSSLLRTEASWAAGSGQQGGLFGAAVAAAGDVDADGFADVIVGAPGYDGDLPDEGGVFLFRGSDEGLEGVASWSAESDQEGGEFEAADFGAAVAGAGDVNGDGYDDVLVGARHYATAVDGAGRALLYLGSAGGLEVAPAWTVEGDGEWTELGWSVAGAGDVDDDGYDDVLVSARNYTNGENYEGRVYFFRGGVGGPESVASWMVESNVGSAHFGQSVAGAGDVDGDGHDDVIVIEEGGAEGVYVYLGSPDGPAPVPSWSASLGGSGWAVASAGDVNGDGFADVVVGSGPGASVYLGSDTGLADAPVWTARSDFGINFGFSVSGAGDVDRDGYDDVVVGEYDWGIDELVEGRAFVYQGSAAGVDEAASWVTESDAEGAQFGWAVAGAGDVDGDGFDDVIVGAPYWGSDPLNEGRAFLYRGAVDDGVPCDGGLWHASECDDSHCYLGGVWTLNGESDPADPCAVCDVATSQVEWSAADDLTACEGGLCRAGVCEASCFVGGAWIADGEPDPDDDCGICAAAVEARAFTDAADGTACAEGLCRAGRCNAAECFVDGAWYVNAAARPDDPCHVCAVAADRTGWTDAAEGTPCAEGLCHEGVCQPARCLIDGAWYVDGATSAADGCLVCDVARSRLGWSASTDDACTDSGGDDEGSGCSCTVAGGDGRGRGALALAVLLVAIARRRRDGRRRGHRWAPRLRSRPRAY